MTMITPSYLGETIEYSSLHACRSTLEDPTILTHDLVWTKSGLRFRPRIRKLRRRLLPARRLSATSLSITSPKRSAPRDDQEEGPRRASASD